MLKDWFSSSAGLPLLRTGKICAALVGGVSLSGLSAGAAWASCEQGGLFLAPGQVRVPGTNPGSQSGVSSSAIASTIDGFLGSINTSGTAFLAQGSALIGAPSNPSPDLNGGGLWVRGVGGNVLTRTDGSYAAVQPSTGATTGNVCNNRTSLNYGGYQFGADFSRLNVGGFNIHLGATAGYAETVGASRTANANGNAAGDVQTGFRVPFLGVYGVATKDATFADLQARWDFFQGDVSNATFGLNNQPQTAQAFTIISNVGTQIALPSNWFVEPSLGIVYSQVDVRAISGFGALSSLYVTTPGTAISFAPFTSKTQDFESVLGRASVRVGTTVTSGEFIIQPFFTGSVYREFAGDIRSVSFSQVGLATGYLGAGTPRPVDSITTITSKRIGTFGQIALGVAGQIANTGWQGYVRGDYRIGDHIQAFGISAGLRYSFMPEAMGRPLISKDGPALFAAPSQPVSWSGLSVGASTGATWGQTQQTFPVAGNAAVPAYPIAGGVPLGAIYPFQLSNRRTTNPLGAGVTAGGQIGLNAQFGRFVVGAEGDASWTNARGGRSCPNSVYYSCDTGADLLAFVTGRVGYAWDRTLFYAKGGVALGDVFDGFQQNNTPGLPLLTYTTLGSSRTSALLVGWTLGAGFEYALTERWSAKAEYLHYDLENRRATFQPQNIALNTARSGDLVRVGVNYRFNFAPAPNPAPAPLVTKN